MTFYEGKSIYYVVNICLGGTYANVLRYFGRLGRFFVVTTYFFIYGRTYANAYLILYIQIKINLKKEHVLSYNLTLALVV